MFGIHENEGNDIGVIAQEVEKILPEIVSTRKNGYMAVKYEKIVPVLIEAIKELTNKVKTNPILVVIIVFSFTPPGE